MNKVKVMDWLGFALVFALSAVLLCGCGDPNKSDYTATAAQVRLADVVGTYVPTAETAAKIKNEGHYAAANTFITFYSDKTFKASNIPDWWNTSFGKPEGTFDSGSGKWSVVDPESGVGIGLDFTPSKGLHTMGGNTRRSLSALVQLIGQSPPYLLHMPIGDVDDGKAMQFEKVVLSKTVATH